MKESESVSCSVMSESAISWTAAARLLCPWNSPCKNTGVGPMPFFWGSSWPGDWTQVPCIAGRFFTIWASREALHKHSLCGCLVAQSCLTLCNSMDCSLAGSSVHGILQARILEWVAMPSSRGSSWPRGWTRVSCIAGGFFTSWATREACTGTADIKNRKLRD